MTARPPLTPLGYLRRIAELSPAPMSWGAGRIIQPQRRRRVLNVPARVAVQHSAQHLQGRNKEQGRVHQRPVRSAGRGSGPRLKTAHRVRTRTQPRAVHAGSLPALARRRSPPRPGRRVTRCVADASQRAGSTPGPLRWQHEVDDHRPARSQGRSRFWTNTGRTRSTYSSASERVKRHVKEVEAVS